MGEDSNSSEWTVNRIDYLHQNLLNQFQLEQEKLETDAESLYEPLKQVRLYIFYGILISVILSFGTGMLSIISGFDALLSSIGIAIVGGLVLLFVNRILNYFSKPLDAVINSYANAQNGISQSQTFFSTLTLDLDKMTIENLKNYANFTIKLALATKISLLYSINTAQKKRFPENMKDHFNEIINSLESELEGITNVSKLLDKENLPQGLVDFTNNQFSEFKRKIKETN